MSHNLGRIIGWWQLVCGLAGLTLHALAYFDIPGGARSSIENQAGWINYWLGCAFFSLAAHAGYRLLKNLPSAVPLALACEALQVVAFAILGGPVVDIAAGPHLSLKFSDTQFGFSAGFNVAFFLGTRIQGAMYNVRLNFLALTWTVILWRVWRRAETERTTNAVTLGAPSEASPGSDTGSSIGER